MLQENNNQEDNQLEAQLRAAAAAADGFASSANESGDRAPEAEKSTESKEKSPELKADAKAESTAQDANAQKSNSASAEAPAQKEDAAKEETKESNYTKAKKEADRRDRSWKALNDEKEAFKAEREKLIQERQEFEAKAKSAKPAAPVPLTDGSYPPAELRQAALDWAAEGKMDMAKKAFAEADRLEAAAKDKDSQGQTEAIRQEQAKTWQTLVAANKDLADPESPIAKELHRIMQARPYLARRGDGAADAMEVAKLALNAARASALEKKIAEQEAEIKKLTKATSLNGSPPSERSNGAKSPDSMSLEEQRAYLRARALEEDALVMGA